MKDGARLAGLQGRDADLAINEGQDERNGGWLDRFPIARDRPVLAHGSALAIVAIAIGVRFLAAPALPPGYPYVTLFPAIIVSAFVFGLSPGILAAAVGGLAAWYWWIPPAQSFALDWTGAFALAFYLLVVGTDLAIIHWMQRATGRARRQRALSDRLAETRTLLFHELQHRVSNNLQVAAALLTLQKREVSDGHARSALDDAAGRLGLIGRISRQLYSADGDTRAMGAFLQSLATDVLAASGREGIALHVAADDDVQVATDSAVPIALIVAEAVANAIEHGFAGRADGTITIGLMQHDRGAMELSIEDDGHGLPAEFAITETNSLGLRIARMLAQQLGGELTMTPRNGGGTRVALTIGR